MDDFIHLRKLIESRIMAEPGGGARGRSFLFHYDVANPEHSPVILPEPLEISEEVNGTPATMEMCIRRYRQIEEAR